MKRARKTQEQTARQLLNWVARARPRFHLNTGDNPITVSIYATVSNGGHALALSRDTADVIDAIARARAMWLKRQAQERAEHRKGEWPHNYPGCCQFYRPSSTS